MRSCRSGGPWTRSAARGRGRSASLRGAWRRRRSSSFSSVVTVCSLVASLAMASGGRIVVGHDVTVPGDVVHLGDIASLEGDAGRLAGVVVGGAPLAGESR